MTRISTNYFR